MCLSVFGNDYNGGLIATEDPLFHFFYKKLMNGEVYLTMKGVKVGNLKGIGRVLPANLLKKKGKKVMYAKMGY